jgi:hypothetical protein
MPISKLSSQKIAIILFGTITMETKKTTPMKTEGKMINTIQT